MTTTTSYASAVTATATLRNRSNTFITNKAAHLAFLKTITRETTAARQARKKMIDKIRQRRQSKPLSSYTE